MNSTDEPPLSDAAGNGGKILVVLSKASRSTMAYAQASISTLHMCGTDFAVMEALLNKGPLPVNTIGKKVLVTSGSITTAVDRLEQRGLVERLYAPDDRRVRLVRLTKEGHKLIKSVFGQHQKHLNKAAEILSQREQKTLIELLKKLGEGVEKLGY
ncbi:MAG: MarR family transcriptional regulator [Candidatus Obscuribacterales bacterium]|nr:MarR family transcriptional regulator [Candidatus Obscuribacterales bacterium]